MVGWLGGLFLRMINKYMHVYIILFVFFPFLICFLYERMHKFIFSDVLCGVFSPALLPLLAIKEACSLYVIVAVLYEEEQDLNCHDA